MSGRSVFASFVIAATALSAAPALAQPTAPGAPRAGAAEAPWYERFTSSVAPTEQQKGWSGAEAKTSLFWTPSDRWGLRLNMRSDRSGAATREGEAAVGAFFQFTPSFRVGGEVSVIAPMAKDQRLAPAPGRSGREEQAEAGVKLESAFKF